MNEYGTKNSCYHRYRYSSTCCNWAWALSILWGWFLVPLGVKSIGVAHAYGFTCVTGLILGTRGLQQKSEDKDAWKSQMLIYLLSPLVALGFGYIALGFM